MNSRPTYISHSVRSIRPIRISKLLLLAAMVPASVLWLTDPVRAETIGGGSIHFPAVGPAPSYGIGGTGFVLVKNWNFGTSAASTVTNMTAMTANFYYRDQFNTINNGGKYGANIVAADAASALAGQRIEGTTGVPTVRQFFSDSLKTYIVPLDGATTITPASHNAGCGSFMAKWRLGNGGSLLNQDIIWETRVRYVTPPYFWVSLWTSGYSWNSGAEMDTLESFGYDNGGGFTNYTGRYWHSDVVGYPNATHSVNYSNWNTGMTSCGISTFDATQYHTWTWLYRKDNTYVAYVDGIAVQSGTTNWTIGSIAGNTPLDMEFLTDAGWGHTQVASVNHSLASSALAGTYYEWDYSRVYLRGNTNEVIQDTEDPSGVVLTGTWPSGTSVGGYSGVNYLSDGNVGKGTSQVRFNPTLPSATTYAVYMRWTAGTNRASNVPVDIIQADGSTTTVIVNEQTNGCRWNLLGNYSLSPTNAAVVIRTAGTYVDGLNGYVIADGVKFVPISVNEVIQDSEDTTGVVKTGTWPPSTTVTGFLGANYLSDGNTGKGTSTVRYNPVLPADGTYQVFMRWTANSNRASNVPVDIIRSDSTTATVSVNQQINGGQWNLLGTYSLSTGNAAVIIRTAGTYVDSVHGYVIADGVKFVRQ